MFDQVQCRIDSLVILNEHNCYTGLDRIQKIWPLCGGIRTKFDSMLLLALGLPPVIIVPIPIPLPIFIIIGEEDEDAENIIGFVPYAYE
jgi:hypothetical protein